MSVVGLTTGDMRQHFMPTIIKEIDKTMRPAINNGDWKTFFVKESAKGVGDYTLTKTRESAGIARVWDEREEKPIIPMPEGLTKKRHVVSWAARGEWTKQVLRMGDPKLIRHYKDELASSPARAINNLVAIFIEYGDQQNSAVPKVKGRPIVDVEAADGLPAFHTAHTYGDNDLGITYATKSAAYMSLDSDSIFDAVNDIKSTRTNINDVLDTGIQTLIIGRVNEGKAYELLHSEGKSETANRVDNPLRLHFAANGYKVYDRMITPEEWFIETDVPNDYLMQFKWEPEHDPYDEPKRGIIGDTLDFAFAMGVADPRRFYAVKR